MLSMHLRQLTRKPARIVIFILILVLLTAFFCVSLNLYANSMYNLKLADETYTTIAIMELYADVDTHGNLIDDITNVEDYAGFHALTVYGYDLEPIVTAPSVIKYDLRARYGAFSDENIALAKRGKAPLFTNDVMRFKIRIEDQAQGLMGQTHSGYELPDDGNFHIASMLDSNKHIGITLMEHNPIIIETATKAFNTTNKVYFQMELDETFAKKYENELRLLNGDQDYDFLITIEPDVEYIGIGHLGGLFDKWSRSKDGTFRANYIAFIPDSLYSNWSYYYDLNRIAQANATPTDDAPFWLYKYSDILERPDVLEKYEQIGRAYYINTRSFGVMALDDIVGIPAFHNGNLFIRTGRVITKEEYESGAKVCMISGNLSQAQKWGIGTKINFDFYEYDYFTNATSWNSELMPRYTYTSPDNFFDSGEYEVVGIYDVRPMTGSSTISEAAISVPWNTIYIPEKSLENAPAEEDRPVTGALLTIWLENGKIEPFIERMNELGITGAKQGDYEARFIFYDQGYSRIQPSLEALSGTAELLLILSSSLLVIAALLLAFFYAQSQKQSIGTMRLLGCSKARAFVAVMLSALIIAVTGALMGAAIGHALTASVGESIMANANQTPEEFLAFSAYLAESTQVEVEFALGADVKVSLLTCLAALGLFIAGTLVFVIRYLGKGPRDLLPRAGE